MPPTPQPDAPRRVLAIADVQTGYHHDSISTALATLHHIGCATGAFDVTLRTDSQLITRQPIVGVGAKYGGKRVNAKDLSHFGALFLLPSGAGTLSAEQKADLLAFVHDDGGGLVVGHAATVGFFDWPDFESLIGGRLRAEIDGMARVHVNDPSFPGTDAFGARDFEFDEQHAVLRVPLDRAVWDVVLSLDPSALPVESRAKCPGGDLPVMWTRTFGRGRVCNLTWGHHERTWHDARFQRLVGGALRWALGD